MLEAAGIDCERGGRVLFRALSFTLGRGELLRIAGANGQGKTSLLRILCGLLAPTAGEVRWNSSQIQSLKEEYTKQLVYLGHAPAVKDELTAAENLSITCTLAGTPVSAGSIAQALERFGIPEGTFLGKLSQGQRRRAALARLALSESVPLWLLDEPLAALDAAAAALMEGLIASQVARGGMVVYTTHQETHVGGRILDLDARHA